MRTIVLGDRPDELAELIDRRRATGADLHDEVWNGEYHMAPSLRKRHALLEVRLAVMLTPLADRCGLHVSGSFNLGTSEDYRVPDLGVHRDDTDATFVASAALVFEVVSPDDETSAKLLFYAAQGVDEVAIADPVARSFTWLSRDGAGYRPVAHSAVLDIDVQEVGNEIVWPPVSDAS
ncbi:hypothetical protein BH24ACT5_BH24ACT5_16670 [soil metagenome]